MALADDLTDYVKTTFRTQWKTRQGQGVPDPEDLKLTTPSHSDAPRCFMPTCQDQPQWLILKHGNLHIQSLSLLRGPPITDGGGEITAYDGDRIMGVFIDGSQSTSAAKCALKINHATKNIIMPALKIQYPKTDFMLRHVVGIDTSPIRVARTGVRGDNDIVWVGSAANHAAKLTEL